MGAIKARGFGATSDGEHFSLYTLTNELGMSAGITDLGGGIVSLCVPDKDGRPVDIELGYDSAAGYAMNRPNLGAPTAADEGFVDALRHVARVRGDKTGIVMDVATDLPGMQLYTGSHVGSEQGKGGSVTVDHGAFCLEAQFFPDAVNHPEFAQPVFGPEKPYRSRTIYSFSVEA